MSSPPAEPAATKKRTDAAKKTAEDDHRRKRRNRTTQSCLNCHTSKRMCDRKRPCGRCTQLGLTGLCVYEVDDPNQRNDVSSETLRLQKRVAELESVIRELKNKPHPKWAQSGGGEGSRTRCKDAPPRIITSASSDRAASVEAECSRQSEVHLQLPVVSTSPSSSRSSPFDMNAPSPSASSGSSTSCPSPAILTPVEDSEYDIGRLLAQCYPGGAGLDGTIDNLFDGLMRTDSMAMGGGEGCVMHAEAVHCGCLGEPTSYNVVLELSLRLRRAAETLAHYSRHQMAPAGCQIHQRIADLDRYTTEVLANANSPLAAFQPYQSHPAYAAPAAHATVSPHALQLNTRPWEYKASAAYPSPPCEDAFMSWEPTRRPTDWPQPPGM
ncbi:Zn(II)2Cys6 transcription factor [Phanerochaete sordida]|uniref:Zn(II)2Cys6 transcription factor n=1 Tax=Phanerochaete sordida TaxID=48140 RepID=A0A9P3LHX3_9APHY|nr:Zn(II)2Cys6 transcription factor [Phanerochaete sordida]